MTSQVKKSAALKLIVLMRFLPAVILLGHDTFFQPSSDSQGSPSQVFLGSGDSPWCRQSLYLKDKVKFRRDSNTLMSACIKCTRTDVHQRQWSSPDYRLYFNVKKNMAERCASSSETVIPTIKITRGFNMNITFKQAARKIMCWLIFSFPWYVWVICLWPRSWRLVWKL